MDEIIAQPGFWEDNQEAQRSLQNRSALQRQVEIWKNLQNASDDIGAMLELSEEENDPSLLVEIQSSLKDLNEEERQKVEKLINMIDDDEDVQNVYHNMKNY